MKMGFSRAGIESVLVSLLVVWCHSQLLGLPENAGCGSAGGTCRKLKDCPLVGDPRQTRPQLCSFVGREPVVCCPPSRALQMCILYDRMACSAVELARRRRETLSPLDQTLSGAAQDESMTSRRNEEEDDEDKENITKSTGVPDYVATRIEENVMTSTESRIRESMTTTSRAGTTTSRVGTTTSRAGTTKSRAGTTTSRAGTTTSRAGMTTSRPGTTTSRPGTSTERLASTASQPTAATETCSTRRSSSTSALSSTAATPRAITSSTTRHPSTDKAVTSSLPSSTESGLTTEMPYLSTSRLQLLATQISNSSKEDDGATRMLPPGFSLSSVSDNNIADTKIVGGVAASPRELPYMALIGFGTGNTRDWSCGASIISENFVMSAAHCAKNALLGPARWARVAELDISRDNSPHLDIPIIARFVHPGYKEPAVYNDIALFRLGTRLVFSAWVQPLCLQVAPDVQAARGVAAGWGRTDFVGDTSERLLKVDLTLVDAGQCRNLLGRAGRFLPQGVDLDTMICAGEPQGGKDTCTGDSGGPLVVAGRGQCVRTQIGVVSFGRQCAMPNTPGIYTKVSSFIPWIESIVWP